MKKVIQLDPNAAITTSQKIASALNGLSKSIYEARAEFVRESDLSLFNRGGGAWLKSGSTAMIGKAGWIANNLGQGFIYRSNGAATHNYNVSQVNKEQWSLIIVGQRNIDKSITEWASVSGSPTDADFLARFGLSSAGNLTLWKGVATTRISTPVEQPDQPHIYTVTFSIDEGLKLYVDCALKAENKDDRTALTSPGVIFGATKTVGWGHYICVDADLSKVEHAAKLKTVHDALKEHYQL